MDSLIDQAVSLSIINNDLGATYDYIIESYSINEEGSEELVNQDRYAVVLKDVDPEYGVSRDPLAVFPVRFYSLLRWELISISLSELGISELTKVENNVRKIYKSFFVKNSNTEASSTRDSTPYYSLVRHLTEYRSNLVGVTKMNYTPQGDSLNLSRKNYNGNLTEMYISDKGVKVKYKITDYDSSPIETSKDMDLSGCIFELAEGSGLTVTYFTPIGEF